MTTYDEAWVARMEAEFARLEAEGLYHPEQEHASCGVGLVVAIDGKPRRQVVENGDQGAEARSGTAARSMPTARPATAPASTCRSRWPSSRTRCGAPGTSRAASGWRSGRSSCRATTSAAQEAARTVVETEVLRMGYYIYGWRHVPVDISRARAEGQRDAAGDRADPDLERQGRRRGDLRARALRDPAADREGGGGDPRLLRLLDELPVDHLQGDDAGRDRSASSTRTCRTRAS